VPQRFTIEQLAAATGLTVRNIREHQTRGLLPPPVLEGRKGTYNQQHLARLTFIRQLQSEGLNLQAIHWLLERAPVEATEEVVRFERALFAPWGSDQTTEWTVDDFVDRVGEFDESLMARAIDLGVVRPAAEDRWEIVSPRLMEAGGDLYSMGIPLSAALDVAEVLQEHTAAVARSFVAIFIDHVWSPFEAAGRPPDQWETVRLALERLRGIATQALLAVFQQSMQTTIDKAAAGVGLDPPQEQAS
jgi:hypothetical protein